MQTLKRKMNYSGFTVSIENSPRIEINDTNKCIPRICIDQPKGTDETNMSHTSDHSIQKYKNNDILIIHYLMKTENNDDLDIML